MFELSPEKAIINDLNEELINMYKVVKEEPGKLIELLEKHEKSNCKEYYYKIRSLDRTSNYENLGRVEKAARTIYLNSACFSGLYRVNKKGEFNTPFCGKENIKVLNEENIFSVSKYLKDNDIDIRSGDYQSILSEISKNDFVYLDPPYMPISKNSSFTSYTSKGFGLDDQEKLKEECDTLTKNGTKFLLSNSCNPIVRNMYKEYEIITVQARRSINCKKDGRNKIEELLIKNY